MYIDTHAHLTDEELFPRLDELALSWREAGVGRVINIGYDVKSSQEGAFIAQKLPDVYFMAGLHPTDGDGATDQNLSIIKELTANEKCLGIGEIGLDYHYGEDRQEQKERFERQLKLASELGLPVSIHARDCTEDMVSFVRAWHYKLPAMVLHCYSMGAESAKIFNKYGCYYAFGGAITFKNNKQIGENVRVIPLDRLLTETDCPYMAPVPFRGKTNEPKYVSLVADFLAELYGKESAELQEIIWNNTKNAFGRIR